MARTSSRYCLGHCSGQLQHRAPSVDGLAGCRSRVVQMWQMHLLQALLELARLLCLLGQMGLPDLVIAQAEHRL